MGKKFLIVTNCTSRKKARTPITRFSPSGNCLTEIAKAWQTSLGQTMSRVKASLLYVGRSIVEAKVVSQGLDAKLFIVSAGIGLVNSDEVVPGYDITPSEKTGELMRTLTKYGASKSDWWQLLSNNKGLSWLLREHPNTTVMVALPSEYLEMVSDDLKSIPTNEISRLRVFTSTAGRKKIADFAELPVIAYDERLESIPGYAGTRSDFPQRALKHFVFKLDAHLLPIAEANKIVSASLDAVEFKRLPIRRRFDDDAIKEFIRQAWDTFDGNSTKLLRHLRDGQNVACEQSRFSNLRRQVAEESRRTTNKTDQS